MYTPHHGMNYVCLRTAQARLHALQQTRAIRHDAVGSAAPPSHDFGRTLPALIVTVAIVTGCIAALWIGNL